MSDAIFTRDTIKPGFYWVRARAYDPFGSNNGHRLTVAEVSGQTPGNYQVTVLHAPRPVNVEEALRMEEFILALSAP